VIAVDAAGENTIVVLPGANATVGVADVDATAPLLAGAGDAFVGALAAGLAAGEGLDAAVATAVRAGAAAVPARGAQASSPWQGAALP
jgi:ribokinase